MAGQQQADEHIQGQEMTGKALKRRGILAAAGAVVAGIVAKQAAQPVAAANGSPVVLGASSDIPPFGTTPGTPNKAESATEIQYDGGIFEPGTLFLVQYGSSFAPSATNYPAAIGGWTEQNGIPSGVYGFSNVANGNGVIGQGTIGVHGNGGTGVYGESTSGYGVLGISSKVGFASISGITTTANVPAFNGGSTTPSALAAYFNGGIYVDCTTAARGQFVVNPMTAKSGLLKHPDGSHRLMYSVEAPESWAEDFGEASLVGGKADVKIDPDFAAMMHTDTYHVFLTAYGNTNGLHVTQRGATGFTVEEHNGGKNSLTFSWRLVAKPKVDNHTATRLAKYDLPAPLHMPTKDELPTIAPVPPAGKRP